MEPARAVQSRLRLLFTWSGLCRANIPWKVRLTQCLLWEAARCLASLLTTL